MALKVRDVCHGDQVAPRAIVMQHRTRRLGQFEITQTTRKAVQAWIRKAALKPEDFLFPSRLHDSPLLGTRQYARILGHWVDELRLDRADYAADEQAGGRLAGRYFLPGIRWRSAEGVARDEIGDLVTYHCDDAAA